MCKMALSLNPVDFLNLFSEDKRRDKEQLPTWLEQVAAEAREIANIWMREYVDDLNCLAGAPAKGTS